MVVVLLWGCWFVFGHLFYCRFSLMPSHLCVVSFCSGNNLDAFYETIASVEVVTPPEYVGRLMDVLQKRRGQQQDIVRDWSL